MYSVYMVTAPATDYAICTITICWGLIAIRCGSNRFFALDLLVLEFREALALSHGPVIHGHGHGRSWIQSWTWTWNRGRKHLLPLRKFNFYQKVYMYSVYMVTAPATDYAICTITICWGLIAIRCGSNRFFALDLLVLEFREALALSHGPVIHGHGHGRSWIQSWTWTWNRSRKHVLPLRKFNFYQKVYMYSVYMATAHGPGYGLCNTLLLGPDRHSLRQQAILCS